MPIYTYTTLDDPSAAGGISPQGINDTGQIVGQYADASGKIHGFLYSGGTYTPLDDPNASRPAPWAAPAQPPSSCKRWRVSAVAVAQLRT